MRIKIIIILLSISSLATLNAQNLSISGIISDMTNNPLYKADILLLKPVDLTLIKGTSTNFDGSFKLNNITPGKYVIKVVYIGYEPFITTKVLSAQPLYLGKIYLKSKASTLSEVNIIGKTPTVELKGDTTQYNAAAYKTNPDANAQDLVEKMPNVTVDNAGKVQAQGEDVKQVLVDGKPFFGDDPNAVLKNVPAEIIDKIQIFDKLSDQSQFTGFNDGNTTKTMNIITKQRFRNGIFGKVYGGYGFEDKWRGGLILNSFNNDRRITLIVNTNNINEQNFSQEDLLGVLSSSGGSGRSSGQRINAGGPGGGGQNGRSSMGGDMSNFFVNQKSGINTTNSFGINYADKWKNVDFSGSYFFNETRNNTSNITTRNWIIPQNRTDKETDHNNSDNINHRLNFKIEWKIDTMNSILFQPKLSIQQNDGTGTSSVINKILNTTIGNTETNNSSNLTGVNLNAPLLLRHSFYKKGRTFSLRVTPGYNQNKGNSSLFSLINDLTGKTSSAPLNQNANSNQNGISISTNITYTEPLSDISQLLVSYGFNNNKNKSDKETYNFVSTFNTYTLFDTVLSNKFDNSYIFHTLGTSYRLKQEAWNFTGGLTYQYSELNSKQVFPFSYNLDKNFTSFLPNAMFQYKFSKKKNLRINYNSSNNAPTITQLQDVINNSNPLQLSTGNPNLKQNWQNMINLRYSSVNTEKNTSLFVLFNGIYTTNYIASSAFIASKDSIVDNIKLSKGSQISKPVNLDGYINIHALINQSIPFYLIKSNLNFNLNTSYTRTPGLTNNNLNYSNNTGLGFRFSISSNISEKVDFTIISNSSYNITSNTLQTSLNSKYFNQNSTIKFQAIPIGGLVLQTDLSHQLYTGLSDNLNQNYIIWNAAIGYKFLHNKQAELRLSVNDILGQNKSLTRNTTNTYYEDVQTNILQRFAILTLSYNIKYFKSGDANIPEKRNFDHERF
ncbi:MAG: TonB-dependent receptor [Bacteroidota bacterium]|nr:TonB-dependent receptor [Bacteroidota bacterium]